MIKNKKKLLSHILKEFNLRATLFQSFILIGICLIFSVVSLVFFHQDFKLFISYQPPIEEELINFDEIDIHILTDMVASKMAVLVDAREPYLYDEAHIPGAISFPISNFETRIQTFKAEIPIEQTLITYCSDINCTDSKVLANRLYRSGYKFILIYRKGMKGFLDTRKLTEDHEIRKNYR